MHFYHRNKATILNNVNIFPVDKFENGTVKNVDGNVYCSNSSSAPSRIGLALQKSSLVGSRLLE